MKPPDSHRTYPEHDDHPHWPCLPWVIGALFVLVLLVWLLAARLGG